MRLDHVLYGVLHITIPSPCHPLSIICWYVAARRALVDLIPTDEGNVGSNRRESVPEIADVRQLDVDFSVYPELKAFLDIAEQHRRELEALSDEQRDVPLKLVGSPILEAIGMVECGSFLNPLPSRAKPWVYTAVKDGDATLKSWGYHKDPLSIQIGAGWTRPQTHKYWACGWSTFRDNAVVLGNNKKIGEQNYAGWTPRGEPNPEVWRSGPWPYASWPVYVSWWHRTR